MCGQSQQRTAVGAQAVADNHMPVQAGAGWPFEIWKQAMQVSEVFAQKQSTLLQQMILHHEGVIERTDLLRLLNATCSLQSGLPLYCAFEPVSVKKVFFSLMASLPKKKTSTP